MNIDNKKKADEQGHVLTTLWKAYYEAEKQDLPKQMSEALEAVKKEARAMRYHWDFYDAALKKATVEVSRDWKLSQSLQKELEEEIEAYDEPIVTYSYKNYRYRGSGNMTDYVLTNRVRLQAGRNPYFYTSTSGQMGGLLNGFIKDDYEYALWAERFNYVGKTKAMTALADLLGETYPNAAWLEYTLLLDQNRVTRKDELDAFIKKYDGKAVGLFGKSLLLKDRFEELYLKNAGEADFKALYSSLKEVEKECRSFSSGQEARIAKEAAVDVKRQITVLESQEIHFSFEDRTMSLILRNLDKVELTITPETKDAGPLVSRTVVNPARSFYVYDTVKVELPPCDDGDYHVVAKNGKVESSGHIIPMTLSISARQDSEGHKFYVADYKTGKPAEKVDLALYRSGECVARAGGVPVDGFTKLPESLAKAIGQDSIYLLEASFTGEDGFLRKTNQLYLSTYRDRPAPRLENNVHINIFTDKGAYNPGETLKFKAVLYKAAGRGRLGTEDEGVDVTAVLVNAEGKEVASAGLRTNEYGSVAGDFKIPEGERNGRFRLKIVRGDSESVRIIVVDEFVLPSYDVVFDKMDSLYFQGDEVEVRGRVLSYSGHPVDAAKATYVVDCRAARVTEKEVKLAPDGSFVIKFTADGDSNWYNVTVRVKDATGETLEFSRAVMVLDPDYAEIPINIVLKNASMGQVTPASGNYDMVSLVSEPKAVVTFTASSWEGWTVPVDMTYVLADQAGNEIGKGSVRSGETRELDLPKPGLYKLSAKSLVKTPDDDEIESDGEISILWIGDSDTVLDARVENFFKLVGPCADGTLSEGEDIVVQMGAGDGPVWAVVELFGDRKQLLERKLVALEGEAGKPGSLTTFTYPYRKDYPEALFFSVFYFRNGTSYSFRQEFSRERTELDLPLSFSRFENRTLPGKEYSFTLKSDPGTEILAAVFDKSSEKIAPNRWYVVHPFTNGPEPVFYQSMVGGIRHFDDHPGIPKLGALKSRAGNEIVAEDAVAFSASAARATETTSLVEDSLDLPDVEEEDAGDVQVRSDFATSLAFEPFLVTGQDGNARLDFKTSDKLSTFIVQAFAHTKDMRNAVLREEMTVSIPVKVSVVEPKYLYRGDKYVLHATVSNVTSTPVSGSLTLQVYSSADYQNSRPVSASSRKVSVPAGGSVPVEFGVDPKNFDELGLKVVFADNAKTFSDGVFISLPVLQARQTLTEAHSAVLLAGMDKDALVRTLRSSFTGTTSSGAEYVETDIRQMLLDAIPTKVDPSGKDVLSLTEALYIRRVAARLGSEVRSSVPEGELLAKILACRNADGGFAWFEGMNSSPVITAVVLERFAKLRDAGLGAGDFDPASSVSYLDKEQFLGRGTRPFWCGHLSMAQYAHVRSMYASVPFDVSRETAGQKDEYSKNFSEFQKSLKDYLIPSEKEGRGLNSQILAKARRIKTLANLVYGEGGSALASSWGIGFKADSKMKASISSDVASLYEYAVEHRDGGWYYPNAVMPWRGLLESELYAHSLLCDLLSDSRVSPSSEGRTISDGIRVWIMLQKETQKWSDDPACVDAINSVLAGNEDVLSTRVILMTKTYQAPFSSIVSAGNGFTIERHFYMEVVGEGSKVGRVEIFPGSVLKVGDKLICEYKVWNQENRSFVRLVAPREAAFRPVNQLSGHVGWWARPIGGAYSVTPQGYRDVKSDRTEYFFDTYPEENTTVVEEFFITQEGTFSAPVVTVESLYAPHYRANDKFGGPLRIYELGIYE